MDGSELFRVEKLEAYGLKPASFVVSTGECVAISGPSGSGKTVLLRAMADLDPAGGHVYLNGTERMTMPAPAWRRQVRYVAAEAGWWADTPRQHLPRDDRLDGAAHDLGLDPRLIDGDIARLSTGERQRLALIRALLDEPPVLLLDEPTGALDAVSAERVEGLIRRQLAAGVAVVLVSHAREQMARLAGRCLDIRDRDLVETAP